MSVIKRGKFYEYDFWYQNQRYTGTTLFETTGKNRDRNRVLAAEREAEVRRNVAHGVVDTFNLKTLPFVEAAELFLSQCETNAEEVSSYKRIRGSFSSLKSYFKKKPVSAITRSDTQEYKIWRLTQPQKNGRPVKRITVSHDMTSLGMFFKCGIVKTGAIRTLSIRMRSHLTRRP